MFENSKWICDAEPNDKESVLFRKEFHLDNDVKSAYLSIVALGYGVCCINGVRVTEDVLATPFTRFDMRVLYYTYDVSGLLKKGKNVIGIYAGNGWYNDIAGTWNYDKATWRDNIKAVAQLDITFNNASAKCIVTDKTWLSTSGPSTYNHIREGEAYDARLDKAGWTAVGFDVSDWTNCVIARSPGGKILPAHIPPVKIIREIKGIPIGNGVFDFGENISGWAKIKGHAESGRKIFIHYSERLTPENDIDNAHISIFMKGKLKNCDTYTFKGAEEETWHPEFVYHGFRYIKVENIPQNFEIIAQVVHTDLSIIGEFECSDNILNKIHEMTRRSFLTNYVSIPTDCPHREQNGWTGDALVAAQQALMNYDMLASYEKWLNDFKDVQRASGQLPGVIPQSSWGYNWGSGPAWDSALIQIPYHIYQITGNKSVIENMWQNMKVYMEYMNSMADDFIVHYGLPDWGCPKTAVGCPGEVTDTGYYYANAVIMEKCCGLVGENGSSYKELAENIKKAYRKHFLKNDDWENNQTFLACGIYWGLYDDTEIREKAKKLAETVKTCGYTLQTGMLGTKYIFTALTEYGYQDVLYKAITNPNPPSYAYWINQGMTTLCEDWFMSNSLNHLMFSEVDMWFYKYVAGICLDENGLKIEPHFIAGLDTVRAKHKDIELYYDKEKIKIHVPCKAYVVINNQRYHVNAGKHEFNIL